MTIPLGIPARKSAATEHESTVTVMAEKTFLIIDGYSVELSFSEHSSPALAETLRRIMLSSLVNNSAAAEITGTFDKGGDCLYDEAEISADVPCKLNTAH